MIEIFVVKMEVLGNSIHIPIKGTNFDIIDANFSKNKYFPTTKTPLGNYVLLPDQSFDEIIINKEVFNKYFDKVLIYD